MARWIFDLVDANGTGLTEAGIVDARNRSLTFQLGAPSICSFVVPLTSDISAALGQDTYQPYVKAWREAADGTRVLRFYGPVWVDEIVGDGSTDAMMVTALDPSVYLGKRFVDQAVPYTATAEDVGEILASLIDATNDEDGDTGLRVDHANFSGGSVADFDEGANKPSIASIIDRYRQMDSGCDFWVDPIEYAAGKIGECYAAPYRGLAVRDATFAYGNGSNANCSSMGRVRNKDNMENEANGNSGLTTIVGEYPTSISAFRRMVGYTSYTDELDTATLTARNTGRLYQRHSPARIAEYRCTPTSRAPRLFDDYDIGDIVWLDFRKGWTFKVQQRVASAQIQISDNGLESLGAVEFTSVPV